MTDWPEARWGSDSSFLRRPMVAFSATHLGSWLIKTMTPLDRAQAAYASMEALARTYAEYRSRTDREIRVFRLDKAPPQP